jgi:hypothetical protein
LSIVGLITMLRLGSEDSYAALRVLIPWCSSIVRSRQTAVPAHGLRNVGTTPAVYHVINWTSPGAKK